MKNVEYFGNYYFYNCNNYYFLQKKKQTKEKSFLVETKTMRPKYTGEKK